MGWGERHRPRPAAEQGRLIRGHERRARVTLAAERFARADAELVAADGAWPDAMTRTSLLDIDDADLARIQERCRVALIEWKTAKAALIEETTR